MKLRTEVQTVIHEVTPENFLEKQLELVLGYLLTRKIVLTDDDLEDIIMSEEFRGYHWKESDREFTMFIRETSEFNKTKLAMQFLDKYHR